MSKSVEEFMKYLNKYFSDQMSTLIDDIAGDSDYIRKQGMKIPKLYPAVYDFCCEQSSSFMKYSAMKQLYDYILKAYINYCTHYRTNNESNLTDFIPYLDKSVNRIYEKHSYDSDSENLFKRQAADNWAESLSLYKAIIPKLLKEGGFELDPTKYDFLEYFDSKIVFASSTLDFPYYEAFLFVHGMSDKDVAGGNSDGKSFVQYLFMNLDNIINGINALNDTEAYAKYSHIREIITNVAKEGGYLDEGK